MFRSERVNAAKELDLSIMLAAKEGKRNQDFVGAETPRQDRPRFVVDKLLDGSARALHDVWTLDGDDLVAKEPSVDTAKQLAGFRTCF
jgi:hypothetical protein